MLGGCIVYLVKVYATAGKIQAKTEKNRMISCYIHGFINITQPL